MLISNDRVIRRYARRRRDVEEYLVRWSRRVESATWRTPQEAQMSSKGVRPIGNDILVFDVGNNRYRVVATVDYEAQSIEVIFVGDHREYERAIARGLWR